VREPFHRGQAREIARATVLQEFRRPRGASQRKGRLGGLVASLIIYVMAGLLSAVSFVVGGNLFAVELFSTSAFMLLVAVFTVMEFSTLVTGPEDLEFYLPLPVGSRTYVAAKMAVTCLFSLGLAVVYALPALVFLFFGLSPAVLGVHAFSLLTGGLMSSLAVTALMGLAVRFVSYRKVREVAGWVQILLFMGVYAGFMFFQRSLSGAGALAGLRLTPLLMLAPSAWAASLLEPGSGALSVMGACLSLGVPLLLFPAALGVVSHAYGGKLVEASVSAPQKKARAGKPAGSGFLWRSPEEKGMSLLIRTLFARDSQFRNGILVIVPITVLYVLIILVMQRAPILDPFTPEGRSTFVKTLLLYFAMGFFPTYIKNALTYSAQAESAWIFYTSPADRLLILRAARRFILVFFIAPYLALLAGLYMVVTKEIIHSLQHFAAVALLIVIEIDVMLLFFPQIPFSRQATAGRRSGAALLRLFAGAIVLLPMYCLVSFAYPSTAAYWGSLAGLCAVMFAVRILGGRYAAAKLSREEFTL
jgi:hypothetical protein